MANLRQRLVALVENPRLQTNKRDLEFAQSLLAYYERSGRLTSGRRPWVDKLEQRYSENAPDRSDMSVSARIEAVLPRTPESSWDRGFLESILEQNRQRGSLSPRQIEILERIESNHSEEAVNRASAWAANYTAEKRERAKICAAYYKANPPYYGDLATSLLENEDFVPTEKQYASITENKYAAKVLAAHYAEPLFSQGAKVEVRKTGGYGVAGKKGFVLQVNHGTPVNAAKGVKRYLVLPVGEPTPVVVEERHLKRGRF